MKLQSIILTSLLAGGVMLTTGCREDWSEVNSNPSQVTTSTPEYLLTQAILKFEPSDYTYWFYNGPEFYNITTLSVPTGSVTETYNQISSAQGQKSIVLRSYASQIDKELEMMSEDERPTSQWAAAAADVLSIYLGIYDTDFIGDIPYTEAGTFRNGGPLTPKLDKVKDLYDLWLTNLEQDITVFQGSSPAGTVSNQDMVFQGDMKKWAKFANSLRLKIAARLISQDKSRALQIAESVVSNSAGYMDTDNTNPKQGESMIFNKATENTDNSDYAYHWNNGVLSGVAPSENLMNFMLDNRDPRIRFIFRKNSWNSKIVQGFLDAGKYDNIPTFILENCNISEDHTQFLSWKSEKDGEAWGEPWVRYYGLPTVFDGAKDVNYNQWFNYSNDGYSKYNSDYSYCPYSRFQTEMIYGRVTTTIPTLPDDNVIQDKDQHPWYGMYLTAAEVNLYLAEFKLLGANLPQTAEYYYQRGAQLSVEEYDEVASLNQIPYYGTTYDYDPNEKVIDLQSGEVDAMLAHDVFKLDGTVNENLEKVYLQQIIHFFLNPIDQFVTARRSGCPKFDSKLLSRPDYTSKGLPVTMFPRRTAISEISPTNKMYENYMNAYNEEGYTVGTSDMTKLNSERVWQDQGAPQWGAGPNQ